MVSESKNNSNFYLSEFIIRESKLFASFLNEFDIIYSETDNLPLIDIGEFILENNKITVSWGNNRFYSTTNKNKIIHFSYTPDD